MDKKDKYNIWYNALRRLVWQYADTYHDMMLDENNGTLENRTERYYKHIYDFVKEEKRKSFEDGIIDTLRSIHSQKDLELLKSVYLNKTDKRHKKDE